MIGVRCHALVEIGGCERHDDSAHPGQVGYAQLTRTAKSAGRCFDLAGFDQGLEGRQFAMRSALFMSGYNLLGVFGK